MRVSVEFFTVTNQRGFMEWLTASLTRPDIALNSISFPEVDQPSNLPAFDPDEPRGRENMRRVEEAS